jgi:hypothetical protein
MPGGGLDLPTALTLGAAHVAHGAVTAYGQVASAVAQATGEVLSTAIRSFGECFVAYMGYLQECAKTARVLGVEREKTARVRAWAEAVIAQAKQQTEQLRIRADLVLSTIRDNQSRREAKMEVIARFMEEHTAWNYALRGLLAGRSAGMSLQEREQHERHINALLERARDMEQAIVSIAGTL